MLIEMICWLYKNLDKQLIYNEAISYTLSSVELLPFFKTVKSNISLKR